MENALLHGNKDGGWNGDPRGLLCEFWKPCDRGLKDRESVSAGQHGNGGSYDPVILYAVDLRCRSHETVSGLLPGGLLDPSDIDSISGIPDRGALLEFFGHNDQPAER